MSLLSLLQAQSGAPAQVRNKLSSLLEAEPAPI